MLILSQIFRIREEINFIICHKICYLHHRNKNDENTKLSFEEIHELILFKDLDRAVKELLILPWILRIFSSIKKQMIS